MYNRILKRPMFKRGGSSFQAQGTGITSPYDTPRKSYQLGSWGEWEQKTRELTQDPRGDWSYAAQGFSELGNPYKDDGSAKTIGEMLYAGAAGVRGSREKARELGQKGELAILESQGGRMLAEEAHKRKLEEIETKAELGVDVYKDLHPKKRYDFYLGIWRSNIKDQHQGGGVYTHPGWNIASKNIEAFVEGDIAVRNAKDAADDYRGKSVHPEHYKEDGSVDLSLLSGGIVYFDPMSRTWFTVINPGPSATPNLVASFTDGLVDLEEFKESTSKKQKSGSELAIPEQKVEKKAKDISYLDKEYKAEHFMPKSGTDVIEESIKTADQSGEEISDFWKWVSEPKGIAKKKNDSIVKKAKGGRIGAATGYSPLGVTIPQPDKDATELEELNAWWKSQLKSKDITDEG